MRRWAALFLGLVFVACKAASGPQTQEDEATGSLDASAPADGALASSDADGGGPATDGGSPDVAADGGCTATSAAAAARADLAAGATSVPVDCAGRLVYSRTLDGDGGLLAERIVAADGSYSVWNFRGATTHTYRHFRSATAAVPSETLDVTLATSDTGYAATFVQTTDTTGDAVPDKRVTLVIDPALADMPLTIERDPQQTGAWAVSFTGTEPRLQPNAGVVTGPGECTAAQADQLRVAFDDAVNQGTACLAELDTGLADRFHEALVRSPDAPTLHCAADGPKTPCAESDLGGLLGLWFPGLFQPTHIGITVYAAALGGDPNACPFSLKSILFHEVEHFAFGGHEVGDGQYDTGDRVYGCQRTCFPAARAQVGGSNKPPSSLTCAACLGTGNDDPRCAKYPIELCPYDLPQWCPCGDAKWYANKLACASRCPEGLACYAALCQSVGGPCK